MGPENGSTELWPGTHLDTSMSIFEPSLRVPPKALERRRALRSPIQPSVRAGSVLIRDTRLWHAGMTNHTDTPRPMLAMIHYAQWWPENDVLIFPRGTEAFFVHPRLRTVVKFVEQPIDHTLHHEKTYGF